MCSIPTGGEKKKNQLWINSQHRSCHWFYPHMSNPSNHIFKNTLRVSFWVEINFSGLSMLYTYIIQSSILGLCLFFQSFEILVWPIIKFYQWEVSYFQTLQVHSLHLEYIQSSTEIDLCGFTFLCHYKLPILQWSRT